MSRKQLPYQAKDISALARSLSKAVEAPEKTPSHVEWLNILCRSAGYKNYQHFKADHEAQQRLITPAPQAETVDHLLIERTLRHFDGSTSLKRWPAKASQRTLCLWWLWSLFPSRAELPEQEVNRLLKSHIAFEDHAILRRALVDHQLVSRTADGSAYRRAETPPSATAATFIHFLKKAQQSQQS
ncbi:DUF2087 domain-containing protein [uncultured Cohaesibacter sp.]|uniref:DUF2087 domain-containing protein n=1 Tax=uncultured Cohaesibacter sp. TaxID=1002546 RepID=UPI00292E6166|nr:DUF2087 domain-containing protein [uncultured Cohaesibacter sp.]